jgi:hypothetical protein
VGEILADPAGAAGKVAKVKSFIDNSAAEMFAKAFPSAEGVKAKQ